MRIDRNSLSYKLVVPSFIIIAFVFVFMVLVTNSISKIVQDDYSHFVVTAASSEATKILSSASADLTSAALLNNPIVIDAKKKSVSEALSLFWSRSGNDGIIAVADGPVLRTTFNPAQTNAILAASSAGIFSVTIGKDHFQCYAETFPLWGWKVITANRHNQPLIMRSTIGFMIPLAAIGCLLMGVGILLVLRKTLNKPVNMMVSAISSGDSIEKTGVTEFDFIAKEVNSAFCNLHEKSAALENELLERIKAEHAVRERDEYIRRLLSFTAEGIFGIDINGVCTFCNPSGLNMLGYASETFLVGTKIHALIHHSLADGSPCPDYECGIKAAYCEGQKVYVPDQVFWRSDGVSFPVEYWAHPILEEDRITGAVVTFIDISQRRELENQLLHTQKLESIGRLAGGVAHDFNNLLTPIMGYSELLLRELKGNSSAGAKADNILKAADKAKILVQQLLSFSRKQILNMKTIDLNQVITTFSEILRRTIRENINIQYHLMAENCNIRADMHQIEQIIMNLTVNAQDAISGNGIITIETAPVLLDDEYCRHHDSVPPGRYVMLAVTDSGSGMNKETQSKIFEPFFTTKGVGEGTGLGLATVHGLVKQHGGNIWVYSEPGRGTTFKLYFPIVDGTPVADRSTKSKKVAFTGKRGTILLVEDNAMVKDLVHELLQGYGFEVIVAEDPEQALKMVEGHTLDLLITDVVMPEMTGPELNNRLQDMYPGIKALYMSGYTSNVIIHHGVLDKGINFIQKPFAINEFAERVKLIMNS